MIPWILISIAVGMVVLVIGLILAIKMKKESREPDYRTWFIIGITWIPLGIATDNYAFLAMGVVFMVLGLVNKNKWKKPKKWSELKPKERKFKLIIMIVLGLLVLAGFVLMLLATAGII